MSTDRAALDRAHQVTASPCSATSASSLWMPTPCSPCRSRPSRSRGSTRAARALAFSRSAGSFGSNSTTSGSCVAHVDHDRAHEPGRVDVGPVSSTQSASREIGTQASVAKPNEPAEREPRVVRVVPCFHSFVRSSGAVAHRKRPPPCSPRAPASAGLLGDAGLRPVELEEQRRLRLVAVELRVADARVHLHVVEELDPGDRDAICIATITYSRPNAGPELGDRGRDRLGQAPYRRSPTSVMIPSVPSLPT